MRPFRGSRLRRPGQLLFRDGHWRYEPIAAPRNIDQITIAVTSIAQNPPQRGNVNCKVGRLDEHFRPHSNHKFLFADQLAGAFDQRYEDIERAAPETQRLFSFKQQPLCRKQPERAERKRGRYSAISTAGFRR